MSIFVIRCQGDARNFFKDSLWRLFITYFSYLSYRAGREDDCLIEKIETGHCCDRRKCPPPLINLYMALDDTHKLYWQRKTLY